MPLIACYLLLLLPAALALWLLLLRLLLLQSLALQNECNIIYDGIHVVSCERVRSLCVVWNANRSAHMKVHIRRSAAAAHNSSSISTHVTRKIAGENIKACVRTVRYKRHEHVLKMLRSWQEMALVRAHI